jgi:hypothetical protein
MSKAYSYSQYADERQRELHKHFAPDSFLGNPQNVDHFLEWSTFFKRNLHRFAMDYLGIRLHLYQIIMLYLMGVNYFICVIASRASAKSFIIALYSCCKCILYPGSKIVLASGTKGQAKLLVSEKIQQELMGMSPRLRSEIRKVVENQSETVVSFWNKSTITVVVANDNARGHRSTVIVREEFRQIKKYIDDSVISPLQIIRPVPYLMDDYYANIPELQEENIDIYISSSWYDNGAWMWQIVDQAFDEMLAGKGSIMLAFDESIALKHKIRTMRYFQTEKRKQDPMTWKLEFLNLRIKENQHAFFTYELLQQNQNCKLPFFPRTSLDCLSGKKNPYDIPKQKGEIRLISCDMAFIENNNNDNSVFSCIRLLPETTSYKLDSTNETVVDNGYRRIVPYMEHTQGGETKVQAVRIRELYEDFQADYIVLDTRNSGISIYDLLARPLYDEERNIEYSALTCMNDEGLANRIKVEGAEPRIFAISASQKLNSDIALDFRRVLAEKKIDFLCTFETASEIILPKIKEYMIAPDADTQLFYETPFLETQAMISETTSLVYEKKDTTGVIVVHEQGKNRKDRYTSVSYGSYMASMLERDLVSRNEDYKYLCLVN